MLEGTCECGYALVCPQTRKYIQAVHELKIGDERTLACRCYSAGGNKSPALNGAAEFSGLVRSQRRRGKKR